MTAAMVALAAVLLLSASGGRPSFEAGTKALEAFDAEAAVAALERAKLLEGPFELEAHVKLYEQLGIAYAYLGRNAEALKAFEFVLALSPGHVVSYTLSPKATLLFERARQQHTGAPQLAIEVAWPRDIKGGAPLPVTVEKVRDARGLVSSFSLFARARGAPHYEALTRPAPVTGGHVAVDAPALPPPEGEGGTVARELYLAAYDELGNEVFRWASAASPRDVTSQAVVPAWYQRAWPWVAIGILLVGGAVAGVVFGLTRPPPEFDRASFSVTLP